MLPTSVPRWTPYALEALEQHRGGHDRRDRTAMMALSWPAYFGRRAVDRLEHRHLPGCMLPDAAMPSAALHHRAEVGDDVAEQVGRHRDVEPLRVLDHPHAGRVDVGVVGLDVGVLLRDLGEGARPDVLRAHRVGLVDQRDLLVCLLRLRASSNA
jgi:hypothetical protein